MHPENIVQFSAAVAYVHTTAAACASGFWARVWRSEIKQVEAIDVLSKE